MPQVVSLGALDMVNFGPQRDGARAVRDRNLYVHNPSVTLMRTTPEECAELGRRVAARLNARDGADGAASSRCAASRQIAAAGSRSTIRRPMRRCSMRCAGLAPTSRSTNSTAHINDPHFAGAMAERCWTDAQRREGRMRRDAGAERLRIRWRRAAAIIGAGAGTGLSAKCAEAGGADLIIIYNSGRFRMAGRGSLAGLMPYGDANAIVVEMGARGAAGRQRRRCWPESAAPTRSA